MVLLVLLQGFGSTVINKVTMINLKLFKGFSLQMGDNSPESKKIHFYCLMNDIDIKRFVISDEIPKDYVPSGSVEFCEKIIGYPKKPDYYPEWLSEYLFRKVWKSNEWIVGEKYFVKPLDRHKRFTGFITKGTYSKKKRPPFWYSEIISFVDEWRYYISNGYNLGGWWYQGQNEDMEAPELNCYIPENFCGTLDFGITSNGDFALVEAHPPYACGWYGSQNEIEIYLKWIINGWESITKNIKV